MSLLYSCPFCELLVLYTQICYLLFVLDLLEQFREAVCAGLNYDDRV